MRVPFLLVMLLAAGLDLMGQIPTEVAGLQQAAEIDVGSFCLTDIPRGVIVVKDSWLQPDGLWWRLEIRVPASAARKPNALFFKSTRKPKTGGVLTKCADENSSAFLKGRLNSATIEAFYRPPTGKELSRWQVNPDKLSVEFGGRAEAQLAPLFGGSVIAHDAPAGTTSLKGRLMWVENKASQLFFNSTDGTQSGVLLITTTDVTVSKTPLELGTSKLAVDLACRSGIGPNGGNVTFSMDVSNGRVGFTSGECVAADVSIGAGEWSEAGATVTVKAARAKKIVLRGHSLQPELELRGLDITADLVEFKSAFVRIVPRASIAVARLSGPLAPVPDALRIAEPSWSEATTSGANVSIGSAFPVTGTGNLHVVTLDREQTETLIDLKSVALPSLAAVAPISVSSLALRIAGPLNAPFVSGSLGTASVRLAALGLQNELQPVSFHSDRAAEGVAFLFDWDVPSSGGDFTLGDPNGQNVRLAGKLTALHLKGKLTAGGGSSDPTLTFQPGGLVIDASAQASVSPLVLGSPVRFVDAAIALSSPDGLKIGKGQATGSVDLSCKALVVTTPSMVFANPDQGFLVQAPLQTDGAASLRFDVGTGRAKLRSARIVAEKMEAKALDVAKEVDISGIKLHSPALTLAKLIVIVNEGSGSIKGEGLHFVTDDLTHPGQPYWQVKLAPNTGLSVPKFDAQLGDTETSLKVTDASLEGLSIDGLAAQFRSADGFAVAGQKFMLSADLLTEKLVKKGALTISTGNLNVVAADGSNVTTAKAAFDQFALSLDGPKDALSGRGSIGLHDISVGGRFRLPIGQCSADQGWKVTGAFDIAKANLAVEMQSSKISGSVDVNDGRAYIVNDGYSRCEWDEDHTFQEEKWAIFNACPLIGNCEVKTIILPAIKAKIHWVAELQQLQASASIQRATLSVGGSSGMRYCLRQLLLSPPIIVANYHPNIREGGFIQNLLRDLIRLVATTFESSLATLIGNSAAITTWLSSALGATCNP